MAGVIDEDGNWLQPVYSVTKKYNIGDKCKWLNRVYKSNQANSGQPVWDSTYWTLVATDLAGTTNCSVGSLGLALGDLALAAVHESYAWPEKFDNVLGEEWLIPGFGTGDIYRDVAQGQLDTLNDYHYTFNRKIQGMSGTYFNNSRTAIADTSDYCSVENNRTMDKVERLVYAALAPKLKSPLYVNADGTLSQPTIDLFESIGQKVIDDMKAAGELSGNAGERNFTIDPTQNIGQSKQLQTKLEVQPVFNADKIIVYNSYVVKLSTQ